MYSIASFTRTKVLHTALVEFRNKFISEANTHNQVICPNNLLEFNNFHFNQVLKKCHKLFTVNDILQNVEIWRHVHTVRLKY